MDCDLSKRERIGRAATARLDYAAVVERALRSLLSSLLLIWYIADLSLCCFKPVTCGLPQHSYASTFKHRNLS